jgi:hypothetical protein
MPPPPIIGNNNKSYPLFRVLDFLWLTLTFIQIKPEAETPQAKFIKQLFELLGYGSQGIVSGCIEMPKLANSVPAAVTP